MSKQHQDETKNADPDGLSGSVNWISPASLSCRWSMPLGATSSGSHPKWCSSRVQQCAKNGVCYTYGLVLLSSWEVLRFLWQFLENGWRDDGRYWWSIAVFRLSFEGFVETRKPALGGTAETGAGLQRSFVEAAFRFLWFQPGCQWRCDYIASRLY